MALKGSIRLQFDRFLDPNTANRQAFCVNNGRPEECISAGSGPGSITFSVEYDPVDRVVVMKPQQPLMPMTRYNVRLLPPKNDTDTSGIRAFDGVALTKAYQFSFTTGDATVPAASPTAPSTSAPEDSLCIAPDAGKPTPLNKHRAAIFNIDLRGGAELSHAPSSRLPNSVANRLDRRRGDLHRSG